MVLHCNLYGSPKLGEITKLPVQQQCHINHILSTRQTRLDRLSRSMDLPNEILISIIDYIADRRDLRSLSLTCQKLNAVATPKLYENVVIYCDQGLPRADMLQAVAEGLARAKRSKGSHTVSGLCVATNMTAKKDGQCFHSINSLNLDLINWSKLEIN